MFSRSPNTVKYEHGVTDTLRPTVEKPAPAATTLAMHRVAHSSREIRIFQTGRDPTGQETPSPSSIQQTYKHCEVKQQPQHHQWPEEASGE